MTDRELITRRLAGQHLTAPTDALTAAGDLCGVQSQFYPQALHALRLRGGAGETEGLVKSWTLRGTLHLFPERDLPLFLHAGRTPFLRPRDTLAGDEVVSEARKAYFADRVLERLSAGPALREELKAVCRAAGMTPEEEAHLFDAWGGLPRALCEAGKVCHAAQDGKVFRRCPDFVPLERDTARRELLRNGEKYIAALSGADYCLSGDDNGAGAVSAIREAEEALRGIRTLSDELGELYKRLESIRCEVYDLAETIRDKRAEFAFSPAELDAAEARTDQLYRLKKKYGATVEDMIAYLEQCRSELDAMETADDTLILLNGKLKKAEAVVRAAGAELTQKRKAAAQALEQRIQSELRDLDMNKVRFAIEFTEKEPAADGCDVIRFLMSANAGEDLRPIAKIASGGELARIMLALKNVLAGQESIATLVFDEVDTGVSGRAAQKVAEKLTQVARHKQVLCVTHLPQLAAMADTHFSVEKGESGGRTFTRVIQLDREARKAELARITGGSQVTPALLESAGELLDQADAYRKQHFV